FQRPSASNEVVPVQIAKWHNSFGVDSIRSEVTQGSSFLATLGFVAESLRDSSANPEGIEPSSPGLRARELPWDPAFQKPHQPRMRLCPFPAINPKRNAGVHLCNIPATE